MVQEVKWRRLIDDNASGGEKYVTTNNHLKVVWDR